MLTPTMNKQIAELEAELRAERKLMTEILKERDLYGMRWRQHEIRANQLRSALQTIGEWDCLNPPRGDLLADLPWLRKIVDAALVVSASPLPPVVQPAAANTGE